MTEGDYPADAILEQKHVPSKQYAQRGRKGQGDKEESNKMGTSEKRHKLVLQQTKTKQGTKHSKDTKRETKQGAEL